MVSDEVIGTSIGCHVPDGENNLAVGHVPNDQYFFNAGEALEMDDRLTCYD